jgi:acyl carrier protein
MDVKTAILEVLDQALSLKGRTAGFDSGTRLLGSIAELDSMSVVRILVDIEERFGVAIHDDEIDASTFATVGSLTTFVESKLQE